MSELSNNDVKRMAREAGLAVSSVTSGEPFDGLAPLLKSRIDAGNLAGLDWFTHQRAVDAGKPDDGVTRGTISRYARGIDYHRSMKQRMQRLHGMIESAVGRPVEARLLTDTARIVDRAVAARSGLGWYGKHTCIIVPGRGSWVMLGELLLDIDIPADVPLAKDCGRCTICLDRCPTGAIVAPYTVDAPRCLSFQTIEQRGAIPRNIRASLGEWVFGCDVCQEVCPYTKAAATVDDPEVLPRSIENAYPSLTWLLSMTEAEFRETYRATPVLRAKRRGLARNAATALGNIGTEQDLPALELAAQEHDEPLVRGHAVWAMARQAGVSSKPVIERVLRSEEDQFVREECVVALEGM
jgi:epoxyqueuosine reductase